MRRVPLLVLAAVVVFAATVLAAPVRSNAAGGPAAQPSSRWPAGSTGAADPDPARPAAASAVDVVHEAKPPLPTPQLLGADHLVVEFASTADLSPAASVHDWGERGTLVAASLRRAADTDARAAALALVQRIP